MKNKAVIWGGLMLPILLSCHSDRMTVSSPSVPPLNDAMITAIASKKIYFAHMSVGQNIIEGLIEILARDQRTASIHVQELTSQTTLQVTGIYHAMSGKNGFPKSKCDCFRQKLRDGLGQKLDIAFFKFCFVDFDRSSNIWEIFDYYLATMDSIRNEFPDLEVVHVTVPLTVHVWGLKGVIKNLLRGDVANIKRNQFNQLLREHYGKVAKVYDLARVESAGLCGKTATFKDENSVYESLLPEYTADGEHLNKRGSILAAAELLKVLAEVGCSYSSSSAGRGVFCKKLPIGR